jgi:endonuclease YncB( thermonuclease family)
MRVGRKDNVVPGGFGKRRTIREPDRRNPQPKVLNSNWLGSEAYDALSPQEKRDLWAKRQIERKHNRHRQNHGRRRKRTNRYSWQGFALFAVIIAGATAWELKPASWGSEPTTTPSGATEVRANFGFCHTGGGYNCVVDGDTIWLEGQNIRIADIDAPETHEYRCAAEKALGDRATQRLQELLNSSSISLSSVDRDEDFYGRKLRLVHVKGSSVGDVLVKEGLARYYHGGKQPWC